MKNFQNPKKIQKTTKFDFQKKKSLTKIYSCMGIPLSSIIEISSNSFFVFSSGK